MTKNVILYGILTAGFGLAASAHEVTEAPGSRVRTTTNFSCIRADTLKCKGTCDGHIPDWIFGIDGQYTLVEDSSSKRIKCDPTLLITMDPTKSILNVRFHKILVEKINKPAEIRYSRHGDLLNATLVVADKSKLVSKERCDARHLSLSSAGDGPSIDMSLRMGKDEEYLELSQEKNNRIRYKWGLASVGISSRAAWRFDCIYEKQD